MSLHHNGHGRTYAICDEPGCDANVIDLSPNLEDANRVVKTFFGWTSLSGGEHRCSLCGEEKTRRRRRRRYSRSWSGNQMKEA